MRPSGIGPQYVGRVHLLDVEELRVSFVTRHGVLEAVRGLSVQVDKGETLGLVGESGAGKSVAMEAMLGLLDNAAGVPLRTLRGAKIRFHCRRSRCRAYLVLRWQSFLGPVIELAPVVPGRLADRADHTGSQRTVVTEAEAQGGDWRDVVDLLRLRAQRPLDWLDHQSTGR